MPATLGMRSMADPMMKNVPMERRLVDVPRSGAAQTDEMYDVLRLMITLHDETLTPRKRTTSGTLAVTDVGNQDIWRQTAPRRKTCATIVNGQGT